MASAPGAAGAPAVPTDVIPWRAHTATALGAGHRKAGTPNQDAVSHATVVRPDGSTLLAVAVADGHGDARHFRSERGSAMAVTAGIGAVMNWSAAARAEPLAARRSVESVLTPAVVTQWNAAGAMDLATDPLTEPEETLLARLARTPSTTYGSTLLLAILTDEAAIFAQIGDGDIIAARPDGQLIRPVPGDKRLDGRRTTSLCQPDPAASFRTGVVHLAACPLFAVLMATDGYGNAQEQDQWEGAVAADLAQLGREADGPWFDGQLPLWAAECASARGSGDDVTLALMINRAAPPGSGPERSLPPVSAGGGGDHDSTVMSDVSRPGPGPAGGRRATSAGTYGRAPWCGPAGPAPGARSGGDSEPDRGGAGAGGWAGDPATDGSRRIAAGAGGEADPARDHERTGPAQPADLPQRADSP